MTRKVTTLFTRNLKYDDFVDDINKIIDKYCEGVSRTEMVGALEFIKQEIMLNET